MRNKPRRPVSDGRFPRGPRGLTPLFWQHVLPYGEVRLDMTSRLTLHTASG
jgi:hypothetical protein